MLQTVHNITKMLQKDNNKNTICIYDKKMLIYVITYVKLLLEI